MTRRTIGIVDYGVGNLTSVYRSLHGLGYRCRVSRDPGVLDQTDLLLLPGVGAFPAAMEALHAFGLVGYLQQHARKGSPIVGICLGMQLLADGSDEYQYTAGLGLIPGNVLALAPERWHIGWNTIEVLHRDALLKPSDGQSLYFNHSYVFEPPAEYRLALARLTAPFTAAVRRENIVGLQFHPEKSQTVGKQLLRNVIEGLCRD
jgi:glutamine amidotransferase